LDLVGTGVTQGFGIKPDSLVIWLPASSGRISIEQQAEAHESKRPIVL